MSLYLKNKIVFIHIPKTGSCSVRKTFEDAGDDAVFIGVPRIINGHTSGHSTYEEHEMLKLIPDGFRVMSIVRHPYDRFLSKFNEQKTYNGYTGTVEEFANIFFSSDYATWDNHNMPMNLMLHGGKDITIIRFENLVEDFKRETGLTITSHELESKKFLTELPETVKIIICRIWNEDFEMYGYKK